MKKISILCAFLGLSLFFFFNTKIEAQDAKRYLLIEEFTNTFCPNCIERHPEFNENVLQNYEDTDLFHIAYHHSTPLPEDIFYQASAEEEDERAAYYGVNGTPTLFMLGKKLPRPIYVDDVLLPSETIEAAKAQDSPISIDVTEEIVGNQREVAVKIDVLSDLPQGNWRLRTVVVEKHITYDPPYAGMESEVSNVFRQTLNGWNGTNYIAVPAGNSLTYHFNYTLKSDWQTDQIYVIAFLQNNDNQEIANAGSSWGKSFVTDNEWVTNQKKVLKIYPNPTQEVLYVDAQNIDTPIRDAQLFDVVGKQIVINFPTVDNNNLQKINLKHLTEGIYFLRLQTDKGVLSRRIVKLEN